MQAQELRGSVRGVVTDSTGGAVTETVRIEASPVSVNFNKTTMETTIDMKMSNSLPIIHRNPFLFLRRRRHPTQNDILIDGSPNTWGPKTHYVPPMDSVSEWNVQQNATDAEFGHSAGGLTVPGIDDANPTELEVAHVARCNHGTASASD